MAAIFEIEVQDNGTAKIVKFETTAGTAFTNLDKKVKKTSKTMDLLTKKIKGLASVFGKVGKFVKSGIRTFGLLTVAIGGAVFVLDRFFRKASAIFTVRQGFQNMAASVSNATTELRAMQEGSKGLIDNLKLMENFNNALALRIPLTEKSMGKLTETALTLGRALGVDVNKALESLVIGIGRQSRLVLDNLGLIVSTEIANKKYARALGKTVKALTLAEQKQAFFNEAMEQAQDAIDKLGGFTLNAADEFTILKVRVVNAVQAFTLGVSQSGVLAKFFSELGVIAKKLGGDMDFVKLGIIGAGKAAIFVTKAVVFFFDVLQFGNTIVGVLKTALVELSIGYASLAKGISFAHMAFVVMTKSSEEGLAAINAHEQAVKDIDNTITDLRGQQQDIAQSTVDWNNKVEGIKQEFVGLQQTLEDLNIELAITTDLTDDQITAANKQRDAVNFLSGSMNDLVGQYKALGMDGEMFISELTASLVQQFGIEQPAAAKLAQRALQDVMKTMEDMNKAAEKQARLAERFNKKRADLDLAFKDLTEGTSAAIVAKNEQTFNEMIALAKSAGIVLDEEQQKIIQQQIEATSELTGSFANVKAAAQDLINAGIGEIGNQLTGVFEAIGKGEKVSMAKFVGEVLKSIGATAVALGTEAVLLGLLAQSTPFFRSVAPAAELTLAQGLKLVAFGGALTAAGAAISSGGGGGGGGGASAGGGANDRQARDRSRQEQAQDKEGRLEINIIGDFIGDERFIDQFAAKITEAGKKRNVFVGVSEAADSAASVAAA